MKKPDQKGEVAFFAQGHEQAGVRAPGPELRFGSEILLLLHSFADIRQTPA